MKTWAKETEYNDQNGTANEEEEIIYELELMEHSHVQI